jgi:hypothetical protein
LEDASGNLDAIYGFDNGGGVKEIPVMYFPSSNPITPGGIPFGISEEDTVANLGAEFGFLSFSKESAQDGIVNDDLSLYTSDGNTYSETPRSAGGQIVPVVYVEGFIGDTFLDVLVGGFYSTVIEWSEANSIDVKISNAEDYLDYFQSEYIILDLFAHDDDGLLLTSDGEDVDFVLFVLDKDRNVLAQDNVVVAGDDIPNDDQPRSGAASVVAAVHGLLLLAALEVLV